MVLLNLGCGSHYISSDEWINIDLSSSSEYVKSYNLLKGIPLDSESVDIVYHSHIIEHFSKDDALFFMKECYRVLKHGGIIRVATPDFALIANEYLNNLKKVLENENEINKANYEWIIIELIDQLTRNQPGGEMLKYWKQDKIVNEKYIEERVGYEFKNWRENYIESKKRENFIESKKDESSKLEIKKSFFNSCKRRIKIIISNLMIFLKSIKRKLLNTTFKKDQDYHYTSLGKFRLSGEIHQWMYDTYSLKKLLEEAGFSEITKVDAHTSAIPNWGNYKDLDIRNEKPRKPDSMFFEAKKI